MCLSLQYPTEWFHSVLHIFLLPSSSTPGSHWLFYCLHSFAFSRCHVVGIVEYAAFSDWLLSLSSMYLRFLRACSQLDSSFLFIAELRFIVWRYQSLSIHLLKDI